MSGLRLVAAKAAPTHGAEGVVGAPSGANAFDDALGNTFAAKAAPTTIDESAVGAPPGAKTRRTHGRELRKGRCSIAGYIYLITTVTDERRRLFENFDCARAAVSSLRDSDRIGLGQTMAYVVMPDHLHWLVMLASSVQLSDLVKRFKGSSARRINALMNRTGASVWQRGFHDHAVRSDEDVRDLARYVVANPLRARLASRIGDYPWWDAVWV